MKNINEYIEESLLDMNELSADIAVKKDEVWRDLMETYGQLLDSWLEISKDIISFDKKGRIIFNKYVILDLNVIPDCIKKYGLGEIAELKIENYRGKISKLNIYKCDTIIFVNCRLEFDKTLNCNSIDFESCSISKLNISTKQPWKTWSMNEITRQNIVSLYMEKLCPGAEEPWC